MPVIVALAVVPEDTEPILNVLGSPCAPCGPCGPVSPIGPCGPTSPLSPLSPFSPLTPVICPASVHTSRVVPVITYK